MKKIIALIVFLVSINFAQAQVPDIFPDGIILGSFSTDPTGFRAGQLYYNTTDEKLKFYNGTVWADLSIASNYEPILGNPSIDGQVLSSLTSGVRSWITPSEIGGDNLGNHTATQDINLGNHNLYYNDTSTGSNSYFSLSGGVSMFNTQPITGSQSSIHLLPGGTSVLLGTKNVNDSFYESYLILDKGSLHLRTELNLGQVSLKTDLVDTFVELKYPNKSGTFALLSDITGGTPTTDASLLTSGVLADARVQESNVTQYLDDYVTEAPIDGKDYVRNNEGWVEGVGDGYINGVSFADNLLTFTREGTNAFTGSVDLSSIIETPLEILAKLITVDGNGSGLDAERLGNNLPSVASADNTVPIRNQFGQLRSRWFASDNTSENGINFLFDFTDRPWSFSQGGTGTSASLDLLSNTSANSFRIGTTLSRDEIVINPVNGDITTQGNFIGNGSQLTNLPTNNTTSTRLTANISGATDLDWSTSNQVFEYTLTADASLSDVSLPQGTNTKVIELLVTGDFVLTIPSTWTALPNNDAYNGLIENHIIVSCINGNSGTEKIIYSLTNL